VKRATIARIANKHNGAMVVRTMQDLYYFRLIIATIYRAILEAQQDDDPVTGAVAEMWLRSDWGALFLGAVGVDQAWAIRVAGLTEND